MSSKFRIGLLVSGAAVALLLYQIDFASVGAAFRSAQYLWVLPGVAVILLVLVLRSWRWGYLMTRSRRAPFESRLSATSIGFMANGLLPARMGEFIRAWSLGRREGTSKSAAFASIVVERLMDGGWILIFLLVALLSIPFSEGSEGMARFLRVTGVLSLAFYATIVAFLVLLRYRPDKTLRVVEVILYPFPKRWSQGALGTARGFIGGIFFADSVADGAKIMGLSFLMWAITLGVNYFSLRAFGLDLPWHAPLLLLMVQSVAVALPSSPGFVGTYHAATVYGASFYDVPQGVALSLSVVSHAVAFFPIILAGLVYLWRENLSLRTLASAREGGESPL